MNRILRTRIPLVVPWALAGLLIVGGIGSCELAFRPSNGLRLSWIEADARSALPVGSSREQVKAWLDASGLPNEAIHDKGGDRFLWYLVRAKNGSWMHPGAELRMTFNFDSSERLTGIRTGQE